MEGVSPTTYRIALAKELVSLRAAAKLQHSDVAKAMGWDASKVSKIESGTATLRDEEADHLLELYEAKVDDVERIKEMVTHARKRVSFGRVADWSRSYLGLERDASSLKIYNAELLHGLFQTEAYATAVLRTSTTSSAAEVPRAVEARMRRKAPIFDRSNPPKIDLFFGEAVMRRRVGGATVLAGQLLYLAEMAKRPNITCRLIPFASGAHAALGGNFTLVQVRIAGEAKTWVYLEDLTQADLLDGQRHVSKYQATWESLMSGLATARETIRALESVAADLEKK